MNTALAKLKSRLKAAPAWQWWVGQLIVALVVVGALAWWLLLPAANSTIGISARTGALTVAVLCGERLVWDLPPGRVGQRSALPGASAVRSGQVTLILNAGARATLTSTSPGAITISVERADAIAHLCGRESTPLLEATLDGEPLEHDPLGLTYSADVPDPGRRSPTLSLPLSGHVLLGQSVQQGAGWDSAASGLLLSGAVALRVVPAFSDERVTLNTEQVEEGSLIDTHGCLDSAKPKAPPCLSATSTSAHGFVRVLAGGGLSAQLYARGPVGVQAYGGAEQHLMTIPNSTAAWRSDALKVSAGALLTLFALLKYVFDFRGFVVGKPAESGESQGSEAARHTQEHLVDSKVGPHVALEPSEVQDLGTGDVADPSSEDDAATAKPATAGGSGYRTAFSALGLVPVLGALAPALVPLPAVAEPVEIRQDAYTGAGFSFRRGSACLVVTARHVVAEIGVPISVLDRTGAKAEAGRTYDNESYDLALVALRDSPPAIACTTAWPQTAWMRGAAFTPASDFQVLRHYPGGKEAIVRLKYAGGTKDRLSLAPADKLTIRESDSGSIVMLDGKPIGIVQSIDTATDRINVLRFDVIDQLVGDRFRSSGTLAPVQVDGVFQRGRQNPNWSAFLRAWVTEATGRQAISQQDQAVRCKFAVDVLELRNVQVPNPEYAKATQRDCSLMKLLGKQALSYCEDQKRNAVQSTPRTLASFTMALEVKLTPKDGVPVTKLANGAAMTAPEGGQRARTVDAEFNAMQTLMAPAAKELFDSGACD